MELRAVDLFCGSGGLSAGFINAGIKMLASYDNWETALETYRRNLMNHAFNLDLSDIDKSIEEIEGLCPDIIVGGPPCQDFSSAGKRVEGGMANLTNVFGKIVSKCKPSFFLMENVPQVWNSHAYHETKKNLAAAGYAISETVLDASYCGVPQIRKRFFAFGSKWEDAPIKFLQSLESRISKKRMTIKEYLGDNINIEFYYRHPRNYSRRSVFSVYEPSPTIRGVNRPVPPGYKGNHLDRVPPLSVRPLTSFERSRIQTFPESWNWNAGNRNASAELQIGNAVPVNLASFVAAGILNVTKTR